MTDKSNTQAADWQHLKPLGYAPGNYMGRCHSCDQIVHGIDKRATRCRPCAEALAAQPTPEPVALQGWDELDKLTLTITFDDDVDCGIEVFGTTKHLTRLKTWLERCDTANEAIAARASLPAGGVVETGMLEQHHRDSAELRRLCQTKDDARRERDAARAEIAGLSSSVGHLSVMVDGQTRLVQKAVAIMKALHESATPDDGPDMNAIIPAGAFRVFVDGHAELMHALHIGPQITTPQPSETQEIVECLAALEAHNALAADYEGHVGPIGHTLARLRISLGLAPERPSAPEQAAQLETQGRRQMTDAVGDALRTGLAYVQTALEQHDEQYRDHPATSSARACIKADIEQIESAIHGIPASPQDEGGATV